MLILDRHDGSSKFYFESPRWLLVDWCFEKELEEAVFIQRIVGNVCKGQQGISSRQRRAWAALAWRSLYGPKPWQTITLRDAGAAEVIALFWAYGIDARAPHSGGHDDVMAPTNLAALDGPDFYCWQVKRLGALTRQGYRIYSSGDWSLEADTVESRGSQFLFVESRQPLPSGELADDPERMRAWFENDANVLLRVASGQEILDAIEADSLVSCRMPRLQWRTRSIPLLHQPCVCLNAHPDSCMLASPPSLLADSVGKQVHPF